MVNDIIELYYRSKPFSSVINGQFPEDAIKKMSNYRLKHFVSNLVKYSSIGAGTKSFSAVNHKNKPRWWPRDVLFELDSLLNEVKLKEGRVTLQLLVIKCCEFFRNKSFQQIWPPPTDGINSWINDENFGSAKTKGVKRTKDITEVNGIKRRKTLASKNETALSAINRPAKAVVYLYDIFKSPKKNETVTKQQFLKSLGLTFNNKSTKPTSNSSPVSKYIKLHNCPHIPLSSDAGKVIIKRENYGVPDYATTKKIERLEWYINKTPPKKTPQHYEVTYSENKVSDFHLYKYPKKQFHQVGPNIKYVNLLLKLCKPLKVVIQRDDLLCRKKYLDSFKVTVVLERFSEEQLKKYVCKDMKVCLTQTTSRSKRICRKPLMLKSYV